MVLKVVNSSCGYDPYVVFVDGMGDEGIESGELSECFNGFHEEFGKESLVHVRMVENSFTYIPDDLFEGMASLKLLELYSNELLSLPNGIFDDLVMLESLSLGENNLSELPDDIFNGLSSLTSLGLGGNKLSNIREDTFEGLYSLENLYLYENGIEYLPPDIFRDLSSLEKLYLGGNPLECVPFSYASYNTFSTSSGSLELSDFPNCEDVDPPSYYYDNILDDSESSSSSPNIGVIICGVIGSLVVIGLIISIIIFLIRKSSVKDIQVDKVQIQPV